MKDEKVGILENGTGATSEWFCEAKSVTLRLRNGDVAVCEANLRHRVAPS